MVPETKNMGFPPELKDVARSDYAKAKKRAEELKAQADDTARIAKVLEELNSYMDKAWPFHILYLLDKESKLLERAERDLDLDIQSIDEVYRVTKEQADAIKRRYPSYLEKACQDVGLALDPESRHPIYSLEQRFFQLKVDEKKWIAKLSDLGGRLGEIPADVDAIIEKLLMEKDRIFGRSFDGHGFLKLLRSEYLAAVKKDKQVDGASIPIRRIIPGSRSGKKKSVKAYRPDEFLFDLSRLVEQGTFEIDGYRLDLQHTKDTSQGMLLHGSACRGYIGFVLFRKV